MREIEGGQLQKQLFAPGFSAREELGEMRAFRKLIRAILRRKYLIAICFVLGAGGGFAMASIQEQRFVSSAQVMINTRVERDRVLPTAEAILPITVTAIESELEVLRSLDLVEAVIEALDLDKDPEFASAPGQRSLPGEFVNWARHWFGPGEGETPVPASEAVALERQRLIESVAKRRTVDQSSTLAAVFNVSFASQDRNKAAKVANAFAEEYLEMQIAIKQALLGRADKLLTRRGAEINNRLAELSRRLDQQVLHAPFADERSVQEARETRDDLARRLAAARERSDAVEADTLTPAFKTVNRRLAEQAVFNVERARLEDEIKARQTTYSQIVAQLEDLNQQGDMFQPDATIITHARPALKPLQPRFLRMVLLGSMSATALAIGVILCRELLQDRLRTVEEIEKVTGLPVLGYLPRTTPRNTPLSGTPDEGLLRAARKVRASMVSLMRTQKVIAGIAALHGEGTSSAMLLLASTFAEANERVLLIDLGISSPYRPMAGADQPVGLDQIISNPEKPEHFVEVSGGVHLLTARAPLDGVAAIVSSATFAAFMDRVRAQYDRVIVDMPPVIPAIDIVRVLSAADLVVMCVAWNATSGAVVASALRVLRDVGVGPVGVVATMVKQAAAAGYADDVFAYSGRRFTR